MENTVQPAELVDVTIQKGVAKAKSSFLTLAVLGFMGGMFIGLAGTAMIRTMGTMPKEWGTLVNLIGACIFPLALICILIAGGELATGNMMVVSMALIAKKITGKEWVRNLAIVSLFNFIGAVFVAYFFAYLSGTLQGDFAARAIAVSELRTNDTMFHMFLSGIACNILVSVAVYLSFASKDVMGKIACIFFPVMSFVIAGFQHVIANMFLIPVGIFLGGNTWANFGKNMISVFFGNLIGGAIFISLMYYVAYKVGTKNKD